jgi:hypothetical protein
MVAHMVEAQLEPFGAQFYMSLDCFPTLSASPRPCSPFFARTNLFLPA